MDIVTLALAKGYTNIKIQEAESIGLKPIIVTELPTTGESNKLYLKLKAGSTTNYEQFLWKDNDFVKIGETQFELTQVIDFNGLQAEKDVLKETTDATIVSLFKSLNKTKPAVVTNISVISEGITTSVSGIINDIVEGTEFNEYIIKLPDKTLKFEYNKNPECVKYMLEEVGNFARLDIPNTFTKEQTIDGADLTVSGTIWSKRGNLTAGDPAKIQLNGTNGEISAEGELKAVCTGTGGAPKFYVKSTGDVEVAGNIYSKNSSQTIDFKRLLIKEEEQETQDTSIVSAFANIDKTKPISITNISVAPDWDSDIDYTDTALQTRVYYDNGYKQDIRILNYFQSFNITITEWNGNSKFIEAATDKFPISTVINNNSETTKTYTFSGTNIPYTLGSEISAGFTFKYTDGTEKTSSKSTTFKASNLFTGGVVSEISDDGTKKTYTVELGDKSYIFVYDSSNSAVSYKLVKDANETNTLVDMCMFTFTETRRGSTTDLGRSIARRLMTSNHENQTTIYRFRMFDKNVSSSDNYCNMNIVSSSSTTTTATRTYRGICEYGGKPCILTLVASFDNSKAENEKYKIDSYWMQFDGMLMVDGSGIIFEDETSAQQYALTPLYYKDYKNLIEPLFENMLTKGTNKCIPVSLYNFTCDGLSINSCEFNFKSYDLYDNNTIEKIVYTGGFNSVNNSITKLYNISLTLSRVLSGTKTLVITGDTKEVGGRTYYKWAYPSKQNLLVHVWTWGNNKPSNAYAIYKESGTDVAKQIGSIKSYVAQQTITINTDVTPLQTYTASVKIDTLAGATLPISQTVTESTTNIPSCKAVYDELTGKASISSNNNFTGSNTFSNITTGNISSSGTVNAGSYIKTGDKDGTQYVSLLTDTTKNNRAFAVGHAYSDTDVPFQVNGKTGRINSYGGCFITTGEPDSEYGVDRASLYLNHDTSEDYLEATITSVYTNTVKCGFKSYYSTTWGDTLNTIYGKTYVKDVTGSTYIPSDSNEIVNKLYVDNHHALPEDKGEGTYVLKATKDSSGNVTYTWVQET